AGPVAIEVGRYRIDHWPDRQYIQVGKEYTAGGAEVFITDIAATDNGGTVIGGEGLVVHAPVEPRKIGEKADPLGLAYPERIEQAHLDLRMLGQRCQLGIQSHGAVVIQQQAYPHTPVGGGMQL